MKQRSCTPQNSIPEETMAIVLPKTWWISLLVIYLLGALISLKILRSNIISRKQSGFKFITKPLKYTSKLCLYSGFLIFVFQASFPVNGLCTFSPFISQIFVVIQYVSMGFHQLSRLYYCFSNDQIHSNKGYPKCLFIFMIIIGILLLINWPLAILFSWHFHNIKSECGITSDYKYYYSPANFLPNEYRTFTWYRITIVTYLCWDIFTLSLYAFKIISLFRNYKTTQPIIYKRITSILFKIFVITLFYEYVYFYNIMIISVIVNMGYADAMIGEIMITTVANTPVICISFCMYLMMDYNIESYWNFLRVIHGTKLHFCCCCCRFMVVEQMELLELQIQDKRNESVTTNATTGGNAAEGGTVEVDATSAPGSTPDITNINNGAWDLSVATKV